MTQLVHPAAEHRADPRLTIPAMYTLLRLRLPGEMRFCRTGHVYDVSLGGMRFELDDALPVGQEVEARVMLPGSHTNFTVTGHVIRLVSEEEPGPVRMAIRFESFANAMDRQRLVDYLADRGLYARRAA